MNTIVRRGWRLLAGLVLALSLQPAAQAGLVTGAWDPQFGSPLTNLGWQVKAEVLVPNACSNQADGDYSTASGACSNATPDFQFLSVSLRLFDLTLSTPNSWVFDGFSAYATWNSVFSATQVRVRNGQIVGFDTGSQFAETLFCNPPCASPVDFYPVIAATEANLFSLRFTLNGPELVCVGCAATAAQRFNDPFNADGRLDVVSSATDLQQFLVTYTSTDTSAPKYVDASGNTVGTRLDNQGNFIGYSTAASAPLVPDAFRVPEPGMPLLVAAALGALAFSRRCAARRG